MTIDAKKIAKLATQDIVSDISDRRGLRQEWEGIDDEVRRGIREEWATIIEKRIRAEQDPEAIRSFRGPYNFLSNFYPCVIRVAIMSMAPAVLEDVDFPSVEHAFQAMKIEPSSPERRLLMRQFTAPQVTAGEAKRLGRKIQLRDDWEEVKRSIMHSLLLTKFTSNQNLRDRLVDTGDAELVEGNTWGDTYWGVIHNGFGPGENHLGKLLMEIRTVLKNPAYQGPA